ncbi:Glutamate-rich protein 1 [Bagarius yarrelli]|uniref:Glutamate-rich protein 1 n=1 Tax=Bagarius yarrelli TaxID=175774 RepID=A0A556V2W3_BAGYA|nr:Glutamate-rich protein 1 [Bagarius yarrelli]
MPESTRRKMCSDASATGSHVSAPWTGRAGAREQVPVVGSNTVLHAILCQLLPKQVQQTRARKSARRREGTTAHSMPKLPAKVLQRLYPATLKVEKSPETPVQQPRADKSIKDVQLQPSQVTGHAGVPTASGRKVYTVLPPPKDFIPARGDELGSPTDAQVVSDADGTAGSENHSDAEYDHTSRRRKRRRKRKPATPSEGNPPTADDEAQERNKGNSESSECLSKNKRRKMKKKRHREKLLALGLVPRSTALEFTYKQSEEDDEDDEEKKLEEVLDFLQSTRDLYLSDHPRSPVDRSVFLSATESIFTCLSDGTSPPAVLSVLCRMKALLHKSEVEKLHTVLQEFSHTSTLPKDETEAIYTLFHYWITEVLPMQTERKA